MQSNTKVLILLILAIACKAKIKTFNEVIKEGVDEETRKVLKTCLLYHVTTHRDVVASGRDLVFKCSGLDQEIITFRQCDKKCNISNKCLLKKHFVNRSERKVIKVVQLFDNKVFQVTIPIRCECKVLKDVGKRRRTRKRRKRKRKRNMNSKQKL